MKGNYRNRVLSGILAVAMVAALVVLPSDITVNAAVSETAKYANEYIFGDFEDVNFSPANDTEKAQMIADLKENGFTPSATYQGLTDPAKRYITSSEKGQSAFITGEDAMGTPGGTAYYLFSDISNKTSYSFPQIEEGKSVVVSLDVRVEPGSSSQAALNNAGFKPIIAFMKGDTHLKSFTFPAIHELDGTVEIRAFSGLYANGTHANNIWGTNSHWHNKAYTYSISAPTWFNLKTIISHETREGVDYYVARYMINNEIAKDNSGNAVEYLVIDEEILNGSTPTGWISERTNIILWHYIYANKGYAVDNLYMGVYDSADVTNEIFTVGAGATTANITLENGFDFTEGDNVPAEAKRPLIDTTKVKAENITIDRFEKTDKLLQNPVIIEDFTATAVGDTITLGNLPNQEGLRVDANSFYRVKISGVTSIDGSVMDDKVVLIATDSNPLPKAITFKDMSGSAMAEPVNAEGFLSLDVEKIVVDAPEGVAVKIEGDGKIWNADANGVMDFSSEILLPGNEYKLYIGGSEYHSFTTANEGGMKLSYSISSNTLTGKIVNMTGSDSVADLIIMAYDGSDKLTSVTTYKYSLANLVPQPLSLGLDASASSYKVLLVDSLSTLAPWNAAADSIVTVDPSANEGVGIKVSSFDSGTRQATLDGRLSEGATASKRLILTIANDGGMVYADDVMTAADGSFNYVIELPAAVSSGEYTLTVASDGNVMSQKVFYAKSGDASYDADDAATQVDGATDPTVLEGLIDSERIDLGLNSKVYDDMVAEDATIKTDLAKVYYAEIAEAKANSETIDAAKAVELFNEAVAKTAINHGKLDKDSIELNDLSIMDHASVQTWFAPQTGINTSYIDLWIQGALDKLSGWMAIPVVTRARAVEVLPDFDNKFIEALIYAVLDSNDNSSWVWDCVEDFDTEVRALVPDEDEEYLTSVYVSKLGSNDVSLSTLDDYVTMIATMKSYEDELTSPNPPGPGPSPSPSPSPGPGTTVSIPNDPVVVPEPGVTEIFKDMAGFEWAATAVNALAGKGIISGDENGNFNPSAYVTREEFTKMVVEMSDLPMSDVPLPFKDIKIGDWFRPYVQRAFTAQAINGISETEFGTGQFITRQDMAKLIYNLLYIEMRQPNPVELTFADTDKIADYAVDPVGSLVGGGVINGYDDNTFRPDGLATRAEAAQIIYKTLKFYSK